MCRAFSTDLCLYIAIDSHPCPPLNKKIRPLGAKFYSPAHPRNWVFWWEAERRKMRPWPHTRRWKRNRYLARSKNRNKFITVIPIVVPIGGCDLWVEMSDAVLGPFPTPNCTVKVAGIGQRLKLDSWWPLILEWLINIWTIEFWYLSKRNKGMNTVISKR